jgi:hypothetical protein
MSYRSIVIKKRACLFEASPSALEDQQPSTAKLSVRLPDQYPESQPVTTGHRYALPSESLVRSQVWLSESRELLH